jgi:hypothetical protein
MKPFQTLLLYAQDNENTTLSYQYGWPRNFQDSIYFKCHSVNVAHRTFIKKVGNLASIKLAHVDAVILLHSVFSNTCNLNGRLFDAICQLQTPKIYFIGNEYKGMPEKMAFCDALNLSLLVTQSDSPNVHKLYKDRLGCDIFWLPYTGLDEKLFSPGAPSPSRPIDLGYRSFDSPRYLGHDERYQIAKFFKRTAPDFELTHDISLDPKDRFNELAWANFLKQCKGQLGSEAGGDFFELTDETRLKVNDYLGQNPNASMSEIYSAFFKDYRNPIPLRVISGRNIEAAGTKTVQILFEGHYNGFLLPDEHYISIKKDFSNSKEVFEKFQDDAYCHRITNNAYVLAKQELTYQKFIEKLHVKLTSHIR